MNDDLTWRFDVAVIEWLIVLAMLVILAVVGAVVTRHSLKALRELNGQTGKLVTTSESWHTQSHCCPVNRNRKGLNLNELLQCKCEQTL